MNIHKLFFKKIFLKMTILWLWLNLSPTLYSQEYNVGLCSGIFINKKVRDFSIGGAFEYRALDPHISLNTDPFLTFHSDGVAFTLPFYLKIIFGEKVRVSPSVGGLINTRHQYGYILGLQLEYVINSKFILCSKNEFYKFLQKEKWADHYGGSYSVTLQSNATIFSLGLKRTLR